MEGGVMQRYQALNGNSGVCAYAVAADAIEVQFGDHIYRYTYAITGRDHVEAMKQLAENGSGLCTYISRHVRNAYESKRRARCFDTLSPRARPGCIQLTRTHA
jgi:hypothetical protein